MNSAITLEPGAYGDNTFRLIPEPPHLPLPTCHLPFPTRHVLKNPTFASKFTTMEIKNLFEPAVKQEVVERIHKLSHGSTPQWGKMNVAQMLAHLQMPIKVAYGSHTPKGSFLLRLVGPMFKNKLWDQTPYKQSLPTDPTFVMIRDRKEFEKEKAALLELVDQFSESAIAREKHPIFGRMSKENWSMATWKHIDHHLRQFGV